MGYVLTPKLTEAMGAATASVYWDGDYLWVSAGNYLYVYSWSGTALTQLAALNAGHVTRALTGDGTYVYGEYNNYLRAFSYSAGTITELGSYNIGYVVNTICCDSMGYIHTGDHNYYVRAFTFSGTAFTLRDSERPSVYDVTRIVSDGTYLYVSTDSGSSGGNESLFKYSFSAGVGYTLIVDAFEDLATYSVTAIGDYVVSGRGSTIVLTDKNLSLLDTVTHVDGGRIYTLINDGQFIYAFAYAKGVHVFEIVADELVYADRITDTSVPQLNYHIADIGSSGNVFYCSGNNIKVARMDLVAQIQVDKTSGAAPLTVNFEAV